MSHRSIYKGFLIVEYELGVFKAYRNTEYASRGQASYELTPTLETPVTEYAMITRMIDDAGDGGEFDQTPGWEQRIQYQLGERHPSQVTASQEEYEMPMPEVMPADNISLLGFTERTENILRRGGVNSISKLSRMGDTQLLSLRNFGQLSLQEVRSKVPEPKRENTYVIKWSGSISWQGDSPEDAIEDFKSNPSFGSFMKDFSHFEESKWLW